MKYLGESEEFSRKKTHTGYKVFNFRMNEYELDTIAFLLDIHRVNKSMLSEQGQDLQTRMRGLRKGILHAQKDMREQTAIAKTYEDGYKQGCKDVIERVGKWLDEDTIETVMESFGIKEEE